MKLRPTAFGWINPDVTTAPDWERAQIQRLARHLGYALVWPEISVVPLVDQVRDADVDAVIVPSPAHLHPIAVNAIMTVADVETVVPRMSFQRWALTRPVGGLG